MLAHAGGSAHTAIVTNIAAAAATPTDQRRNSEPRRTGSCTEVDSDADFELYVDDEKLCLFQDAKGQAWFGHACLAGDHEVRVRFGNWSCKRSFDIDVYRIR